jgi:hypothetical protein
MQINDVWRGAPVAPSAFVVHSLAASVVRLFPVPGVSAMAPLPPPTGDGVSISSAEVALAYASEPLLQVRLRYVAVVTGIECLS